MANRKPNYFSFPWMPDEEWQRWVDRIVTLELLEDIIFSCECNLDHSKHYWESVPIDMREKKLAFFASVKKRAASRIMELTVLS